MDLRLAFASDIMVLVCSALVVQVHGRAGRVADPALAKWKQASVHVRCALQMGGSSSPWTSRQKLLRGLPDTPRVRDLLDVCWHAAKRAQPHLSDDDLAATLYCNTSQSVSRLPCSFELPTQAGSAAVYHYASDAVLTGFSRMRLHGWSPRSLDYHSFTQSDLKKLSGQAFSVPLATLLTLVTYLNADAPWWR